MRNYKNKTYWGTMPKETYLEAANVVMAGSSLRKAANKHGLNSMTLQRFYTKMKSTSDGK